MKRATKPKPAMRCCERIFGEHAVGCDRAPVMGDSRAAPPKPKRRTLEEGRRLLDARAKPQTFKRKYVLGEGYPWAMGPYLGPFLTLGMAAAPRGVVLVPLDWPDGSWSAELPRYRLVLERIDEDGK